MIGKLFAGFAAAGVMAAVLATGAMAAPATASASSPTSKTRPAAKDDFGGVVSAISDTQLTVKSGKAGTKTFLREDGTVVVTGRNDKATWSEIEVNSQVRVRFEERNGQLYAKRIHLGQVHLAGRVESVSDTSITIRTRDGKDLRLTVNNNTKYFEIVAKGQRKAGSLADIHAGMRIAAAGSYDASHNFDATIVAYRNK